MLTCCCSQMPQPMNMGSEMQYFRTTQFDNSLKEAQLRGGKEGLEAARTVKAIIGSLDQPDPFSGLTRPTRHGETRIRHCVKYDLIGFWRLVTIQNQNACFFLYVGNHDDTDRWLDRNRGMTIGVESGRAISIPGANGVLEYAAPRWPDREPLVNRLGESLADHLLEGIPRSIARRLEKLDASAAPADVEGVCSTLDESAAALIITVFSLLLVGNVDGAEANIRYRMGGIPDVEELDAEQLLEVGDGTEIRRIRIGSVEYERWLNDFEKNAVWHEWFLYLHPEQSKVVDATYPGPAQLSGVSGSGKTCVAVRRAIRLAESSDSRVLVVTLNRSLAGLLRQLVVACCTDAEVRERLHVTSFFELAQRLLLRFEPENERIYADVTWKLNEHVDEIFREYYRRWLNCDDAAVLMPLHKSLSARGVIGEVYLREEFDWIRSAVRPSHREDYLEIDRIGRRFSLPQDRRGDILNGLAGWERKMTAVGVIDYLGLTSALARYLDELHPEYSHVIVDEAQDFGTTELQILRRLVPEHHNDLFLCGDVAQTILPKHRNLAGAGIPQFVRERIYRNYRNSREILTAAYELLKQNLHEDMVDSPDLEILDPKYANFSGSVPMALAADSLEDEIAYARSYAASRLSAGARTVCIAFAGFSTRDIAAYAAACGVAVLRGDYDPSSERLVFCDLEQTKGYEFDTLIILQCASGVLPPRGAPDEEVHRASCKLYVAMTRARRELILSFHGEPSPWVAAVSDKISTDLWSEVEVLNPQFRQGVPRPLPEIQPGHAAAQALSLTGEEFLYTADALGLPLEVQQKLTDVVTGRERIRNGKKERWPDVGALLGDLLKSGMYDAFIGKVVSNELRRLAHRIGVIVS